MLESIYYSDIVDTFLLFVQTEHGLLRSSDGRNYRLVKDFTQESKNLIENYYELIGYL